MGQTYVRLTAEQANTINTLNTSGPGGQQGGSYWLEWTIDGFTGTGWYWDDPNNLVDDSWVSWQTSESAYKNNAGEKYASNEGGLRSYVTDNPGTDLNDIFADWNRSTQKGDFVTEYMPVLWPRGCVTF